MSFSRPIAHKTHNAAVRRAEQSHADIDDARDDARDDVHGPLFSTFA